MKPASIPAPIFHLAVAAAMIYFGTIQAVCGKLGFFLGGEGQESGWKFLPGQ